MSETEDKRSFIQRLFTRIAPRYDWFNRLASCGLDQGWRRLALARGAIGPGQRILDVCTGTGDLALLCARSQHGSGSVIGVDLNAAMLSFAHQKSRRGTSGPSWAQADALQLPFADASVDRVTIGFSTRNLSDLQAGLREFIRVLRPDGRLIILETGRPANPVVRFGYQLYLFTYARAVGWLLTGRVWPFTYLATSVKGFVTPAQMVEYLQRAETTVEYLPLSCGLASLFVATKQRSTDARNYHAQDAYASASCGGTSRR